LPVPDMPVSNTRTGRSVRGAMGSALPGGEGRAERTAAEGGPVLPGPAGVMAGAAVDGTQSLVEED
jgi:hypothetical protein